jgi:hypothetical protein
MSNEFVARKGLISLTNFQFQGRCVYFRQSSSSRYISTSSHLAVSGSAYISKGLVVDGITGCLFGTSSWAVSASWAPNAGTASYANNSNLLDGLDSTIFATTGIKYIYRQPDGSRMVKIELVRWIRMHHTETTMFASKSAFHPGDDLWIRHHGSKCKLCDWVQGVIRNRTAYMAALSLGAEVIVYVSSGSGIIVEIIMQQLRLEK